jgi:hypothetical protein
MGKTEWHRVADLDVLEDGHVMNAQAGHQPIITP